MQPPGSGNNAPQSSQGSKASPKPSDDWPQYTDSKFSTKHITKHEKKQRTSSWYLTAANIAKMYLGIAFISVPMFVKQAGLYGAIIGFAYVSFVSIFTTYLLIATRNRFKRENIVDVCDLAARLYGEGIRPIMSFLLVFTNGIFLMCYIMFFGTQTDQLVCKTFKSRECGSNKQYSLIILTALLPILFLRKLTYIGYFSMFILCFTIVAIVIIIYLSSTILSMSPEEAREKYHIPLKDDDRDYVYWDTAGLPIFASAAMSLFEGDQ